jgi:high-affinity nickel-transport protein
VVVAAVLTAQALAGAARPPVWLEAGGGVVSVLVLFALGALNLAAVLGTPRDSMVTPLGLRGPWLTALTRTASPWLVAGVGALFALSFDTLSQAMVFALAGTQSAAAWYPCALALLFMGGMVAVDGANGLWVARLLCRADATARTASRLMGLAVALLSFAVGALGVARLGSPAFAAWGEQRELAFGAAVVFTVLLAFGCGSVLARNAQRRDAALARLGGDTP